LVLVPGGLHQAGYNGCQHKRGNHQQAEPLNPDCCSFFHFYHSSRFFKSAGGIIK
jgi:hypothetical protein